MAKEIKARANGLSYRQAAVLLAERDRSSPGWCRTAACPGFRFS